ncbi:serine protease [Chytridiales sp. JEL 0842]|nr:serine protease [Chytridiales sp. JEL 0842]
MKFLATTIIVWATTLTSSYLASAQLIIAPDFAAPIAENWKPIAPLFSTPEATIIKDRFIVVLKEDVSAAQFEAHTSWVTKMISPMAKESDEPFLSTFGTSNIPNFPKGYAVTINSKKELHRIRSSPDVKYVEPDQVVQAYNVQENAPWGLSRISHLSQPEAQDYVYNPNAGANVTVYIIDTGINIEHEDFEGRAVWGKTIPSGDKDEDGNGHGTHCAGTVGGRTYGVAKKAKLVAVKVLRSNGSGSMSDVLKGIDWAAAAHLEQKKTNKKAQSVANMSLGGGKSEVLDKAVDAAVAAGVHFAVAAGNDNQDACRYSPAAAKNAVTVLATTSEDARAWFSNWGKCIDIGAPGHQILSAWIGSKTANNTISGTSMASPHVAGVIASLISREGTEWAHIPPLKLKEKLIDVSIKNVITGMPPRTRTRNRLLWSVPPTEGHHDNDEISEL